MEKLSIDQLKNIELDILIFIDDICKKNNIGYSLYAGTMLGAVRHKGFIPWDDDIDITMTRKNYAKFVSIFKEKYSNDNDYVLVDESYKNYGYMFSKMCSKKTVLIEKHNRIVKELGVFVDIFPVDFISDEYNAACNKLKKINWYKAMMTSWNWRHFYINRARGFFRQIPRFIFFVLSRFYRKDSILRKIKASIPNEYTQYSCIWVSPYGSKEIMKTSIFNDYTNISFEGHDFMCFSQYDVYLKNIYGDYMQLPPENKRVTHHTFDAYYRKIND